MQEVMSTRHVIFCCACDSLIGSHKPEMLETGMHGSELPVLVQVGCL